MSGGMLLWSRTVVRDSAVGQAEEDRYSVDDGRSAESVSISDQRAIIGALYDDDDGNFSGSAYIFTSLALLPGAGMAAPVVLAGGAAAAGEG